MNSYSEYQEFYTLEYFIVLFKYILYVNHVRPNVHMYDCLYER